MKTMPAAEAKTNFGTLLDTAQREPVTISKKRAARCSHDVHTRIRRA